MWPRGLGSHRRGEEQRGTGGLTGQMASGHSAHLAHRLLLGRRSHPAVQCVVGAVLSREKQADAVFQPGKMKIRVAGGKQESWFPPRASCLWKEALWAALVPSVLVSLPSLAISGTRGGRSGMPQAAGGGSCDGGVGTTRVQVCSCCWTCGNGGELFVLKRK